MIDPTETSADEAMNEERLAIISSSLAPWEPALSGRSQTKQAACELLAEVYRLHRRLAAATERAEKAEADHRAGAKTWRQHGLIIGAAHAELRRRLTDLGAIATELQSARADHREARAAMNAVVERWSKQTVEEREAIKTRIDQAQARLFKAQDAWMAAARGDWPIIDSPAERKAADDE